MMKKIIDAPEAVVSEMLAGLAFAHSDIVENLADSGVVISRTMQANKVGLVSGGGSGHEPAHAGFVGQGMLSAAVCGPVFTSPTPDRILEAIQAVDQGAGVFLIIKNYSGDVMNFEMAQELAEMEDIQVETIVVDDDIEFYRTSKIQVNSAKIVYIPLHCLRATGMGDNVSMVLVVIIELNIIE